MQRRFASLCLSSFLAAALAVVLSMSAQASTVVSVLGPDTNGIGISEGSQAGAVSFTTSQTYSDVHIFALVGSGPAVGVSFLTTNLGPATTPADQIGVGSFSVAQGPAGALTDVLDIATLNAGTYFLSLFGSNLGTYGFEYTSSPTVITDAGASVGGSIASVDASAGYSPASPFTFTPRGQFQFEVIAGTPEPASIGLFCVGAAALFALSRFRCKAAH